MLKLKTIADAELALRPYVPLVAQLTGKDTTLSRIKPLMNLLGNPEDNLHVIHIAGTSGKTSTSYYIAALLRATGLEIGLTVSPHVDSITERVQLNGLALADDRFCAELEEFLGIVEQLPNKVSYFELMYAFALWVFSRANVDYAVVETGMGGLYDATNVITRADKICVITDIGFDHMHILGYTLPEIAAQKIGIVHQHNEVITYKQPASVMPVINKWITTHQAVLHVTSESAERKAYGNELLDLPRFQRRNWLLASAVYTVVRQRDNLAILSSDAINQTQTIQIPGRMDIKSIGDKTVVMDGAHNGQKMRAFIASFNERFPDTKPAILVSLKQGKDYREVVEILAEIASRVIVTSFDSSQDLPARSIDPAELTADFRGIGFSNVEAIPDQRVAWSKMLGGSEAVMIVTGSFYLLGQIRNAERLT